MLEKDPGRYLITQRAKHATLPLLWEFPGGRVHDGERDEDALRRELHERLGLEVVVQERAMETTHDYETYSVVFHVYRCRLSRPDQEVSHAKVNDHRWAGLDEMGQFQFPPADARTLARLLDLDM